MQLQQTEGALYTSFGFYVVYSVILASCAGVITVHIAPGATGSGIPELMGTMNGCKWSEGLSFKVLVFKTLGVILAVSGTLCVGKEGPLAHIGAIMAVLVLGLPFKVLQQFQLDVRKREFIAAGISAGVSVAFGAPIGGTLFAYEISTPNTFWTFNLLWRNFFCSAMATFVLGCLTSSYQGKQITLSDCAMLKFGIVAQDHRIPYYELLGAVIIGLICGILGAIFMKINTSLMRCRKKYIRRKWQKVLEVSLFSALTASTFFMIALSMDRCNKKSDTNFRSYHRARCQADEYSPMATLFFNTEGGTIRAMLSKGVQLTIAENFAFFLSWYILFSLTYGITVPAGVFLPGIIIGLSVGQLYGNVYTYLFPSQAEQ